MCANIQTGHRAPKPLWDDDYIIRFYFILRSLVNVIKLHTLRKINNILGAVHTTNIFIKK